MYFQVHFFSGIMEHADIRGLVEYMEHILAVTRVEFWPKSKAIIPHLLYFPCCSQFIATLLNLERSLPLTSVSLLIPERSVMTHFLPFSLCDSDA